MLFCPDFIGEETEGQGCPRWSGSSPHPVPHCTHGLPAPASASGWGAHTKVPTPRHAQLQAEVPVLQASLNTLGQGPADRELQVVASEQSCPVAPSKNSHGHGHGRAIERRRLGPLAEAGPLAQAGVGRAALLGWPWEGGPFTRWRGLGALGRHVLCLH